MCYGKKTDFVDSSVTVTLLENPSIHTHVVSDLLSYSAYAHHPPEVATLAQDSMASRLPIIPVDFVPFGLSCQALAVKIYRSSFQEGGNGGPGLPYVVHAEFLKVYMENVSFFLEGRGGGVPSPFRIFPQSR